MVGAFGLFEDHHTRIPADRLIENRARVDVTMLNRSGALVDGAETELRSGDGGCRLATRTPNLLVDGNPVLVVWTDWALPWFECPVCGRRCRHVYLLYPIACRQCHRLSYAVRHLYRQTPAVHRVARLRRKLGAEPRPFAPLPASPPGRHRAYYERLVAMIQDEEQSLVEHLQTVTHYLERRIAVRKRKHQW